MFSMVLLYHMPTQLSLSPSASLLPCTVVAADFADSECEASAKSGVVPALERQREPESHRCETDVKK